jgi:predicted PurR-regulated permease PerM
MQLSPLDDRYELELFERFNNISRSVVMAVLLSAFVQGLLAGVGYYLADIPVVFALTALTMLLAVVPFLGAASVWVPTAAWLYFAEGRTTAAILLALYGAGVVSAIDNVIKPWVLHGQSKLHPLLGLLSVLGGVAALGPIGILVGPMAVAFLQALLGMLRREIDELGDDGVGLKPAALGADGEQTRTSHPAADERSEIDSPQEAVKNTQSGKEPSVAELRASPQKKSRRSARRRKRS